METVLSKNPVIVYFEVTCKLSTGTDGTLYTGIIIAMVRSLSAAYRLHGVRPFDRKMRFCQFL